MEENTDRLVIKALAFPLTHPEADDEMLSALKESVADLYSLLTFWNEVQGTIEKM